MLTHVALYSVAYVYSMCLSVFDWWVYQRGKLCIVDQMQKRLEEKMLQEEVKEQEGQHMLEDMERVQMEELKVHARCGFL